MQRRWADFGGSTNDTGRSKIESLRASCPAGKHAQAQRLAFVASSVLFVCYAYASAAATAGLTLLTLGLASRPRPPAMFLRFLHCTFAAYISALFAASVIPRSAVTAVLESLDHSFPSPAPRVDPRTNDCSLTTQNVRDSFDFYVLAHCLGHLIKAVVLPDRYSLWLSAIAFELIESSLAHAFPGTFGTLAECFWDKFVLDLLLSDAAGIELGLLVVGNQPLERWSSAALCASLISLVDILHFGLISALHISITSPLLSFRMALYAAGSFQAVSLVRKWERNEGKVWPSQPVILFTTAICTEILLCVSRLVLADTTT
jgi:hypothetical protein